MSSVANKLNEKPARRSPSSTAKASKRLKKGGLRRSAGLRRGQENQGQEAACSRRYIRPAASRCCPSCQRPRSRWSHSRHGDPVRDVSLFEDALRRRRISRTAICESAGKSSTASLTLKSSNVPIGSADLLSCPNAGLSSARLPGSIAAEGSPRIGRTAIGKRLRSCTSPQFGSCLENFVIRPKVSGQTLTLQLSFAFEGARALERPLGELYARVTMR